MTDHSIIQFEFEGNEFQAFIADDGEPRFFATHVCKSLEIRNVSDALSRLDDDEKGIVLNDTPSIRGATPFSIVTEAGLYRLIFSSRKKSAERFKRWIAHEVLPAIRKQGGYISSSATSKQLEALQSKLNIAKLTIARLERKTEDQDQVMYWLGKKQGAGKFLEDSLPNGDRD